MAAWLGSCSQEIKSQPQPQKERLFVLSEIRRVCKDCDFKETAMAVESLKDGKPSDIVYRYDTWAYGKFEVRLKLGELPVEIKTDYSVEELTQHSNSYLYRNYINALIPVRQHLNGMGIDAVFLASDGTRIENFPNAKIKAAEEGNAPSNHNVPVDDEHQEFIHDAHSGNWYGVPK